MSKAITTLDEMGKDGELSRSSMSFRNKISPDGPYPAEKNRYHLYIAYACPWASRCLAVLYMKGLEDVIGLSIVHPTWQKTRPEDPEDEHHGWVFRSPDDPPVKSVLGYGSFPCTDCIPDTVNNCKSMRELYELSSTPAGGKLKPSVPVFWDKKTGAIVNNESAEIMKFLNDEFNEFATNPTLNLFPAELADKIEEVNDWVYPNINDGVYRCGFAQAQGAYEKAAANLFENLDKAEEILSKQRYLAGDKLTAADIRAFVTLVRFDEVYVVYFKCNKKMIREYPNILNYVRDIYQTPGVAQSVNMDQIKTHYYTSHHKLNTYAVIPVGPGGDIFNQPHGRDKKFSS